MTSASIVDQVLLSNRPRSLPRSRASRAVLGEVVAVGLVAGRRGPKGQAPWRRFRQRRDVKRGQGACRQASRRPEGRRAALPRRVTSVSLRRVGHGHQLAARAEPDVAVLVGPRRVEQRDSGSERRQQDDGIASRRPPAGCRSPASRASRLSRSEPMRPRSGHEGHALFRRLQRRVDRGAGGFADRHGGRLQPPRRSGAHCRARRGLPPPSRRWRRSPRR